MRVRVRVLAWACLSVFTCVRTCEVCLCVSAVSGCVSVCHTSCNTPTKTRNASTRAAPTHQQQHEQNAINTSEQEPNTSGFIFISRQTHRTPLAMCVWVGICNRRDISRKSMWVGRRGVGDVCVPRQRWDGRVFDENEPVNAKFQLKKATCTTYCVFRLLISVCRRGINNRTRTMQKWVMNKNLTQNSNPIRNGITVIFAHQILQVIEWLCVYSGRLLFPMPVVSSCHLVSANCCLKGFEYGRINSVSKTKVCLVLMKTFREPNTFLDLL